MPLAGRHELPPLTMGDLSIAADELLRGLGGAGVMTEGDFEALIRMEVTFARKKGEYYACYEFGTYAIPAKYLGILPIWLICLGPKPASDSAQSPKK